MAYKTVCNEGPLGIHPGANHAIIDYSLERGSLKKYPIAKKCNLGTF